MQTTLKRSLVWYAAGLLAFVGLSSSTLAQQASDQAQGGATAAPKFEVDPLDWPTWRGPQNNSVSVETDLPEKWTPAGENLLWKREDLGTKSTPICMRGKLYFLCRHNRDTENEQEKVVCVDAATGKTIWEHVFNVYLSDVPDTRLGWSNVTGDPTTGRVYAQGVCGYFVCLEGDSGKPVWSHSMHEEFGLLSTYGGRTNTPVIFEDLVIISAVMIGWGENARPNHRFMAMDKATGKPIWFNATRPLPEDTTFNTPAIGVFNGQVLMVVGSGDGSIYGMQPRTGKIVWQFPYSVHGINSSPLIVGDKVVICHAEENVTNPKMGAIALLDPRGQGTLNESYLKWKKMEITVGRASPTVIGDNLYVVDDSAGFVALDMKTGAVKSKQKLGTVGRSCPLFVDGKVYACEANGRAWVFKIDEKGALKVAHRVQLKGENQASPICSHGRIYLATTESLFCIGKKDHKSNPGPMPEKGPAEAPAGGDLTPAQIAIVPCEVMIKPGDKVNFETRVYNSFGQLLQTSPAKYAVQAGGTIDGDGVLTSANVKTPVATNVVAKVGELTATAKVRIIPDLPWSVDFNDGKIPATWGGIRYRHIALDEKLYEELTASDPMAGQLYIYLNSNFANRGTPNLAIDDSTPQQAWSALLRFVNLEQGPDRPKTVEAAQAKLGASLKRLVDEKVLAKFTFQSWDRKAGDQTFKEPKLVVAQGDRPIGESGIMCKITTIPKGTRSQGWFGRPDLSDYTIQADLRAFEKLAKLPDMGVINQRYTLDMMGNQQQLQVRSWVPHLYRAKTIPFKWKAGVWYTMKLMVTHENGKAILKGKVWPRAESEPANWTIEHEDPLPNMNGAPGLFGNASNAEIFIDNIKVTPNK